MALPGEMTITFNPLAAIVGVVVFLGAAVILLKVSEFLSWLGGAVCQHTRLEQLHLFLISIVLALIAVPVNLLVGWKPFVVLGVTAVILGGMGDRRANNWPRRERA